MVALSSASSGLGLRRKRRLEPVSLAAQEHSLVHTMLRSLLFDSCIGYQSACVPMQHANWRAVFIMIDTWEADSALQAAYCTAAMVTCSRWMTASFWKPSSSNGK